MMDSLAKLEISIRPQSVPSWLNSDEHHAPKVPPFPTRANVNVEYIHSDGVNEIRPRAPILLQKVNEEEKESVRPKHRTKRSSAIKRYS